MASELECPICCESYEEIAYRCKQCKFLACESCVLRRSQTSNHCIGNCSLRIVPRRWRQHYDVVEVKHIALDDENSNGLSLRIAEQGEIFAEYEAELKKIKDE